MARRDSTPARRRARADNDDNAFVRSRTISSYDIAEDSQKRATQLERKEQKKRLSRRRKVLAGVVVLIVLLVACGLVASQYVFNINSSAPGKYIEIADNYLASHPASRFSFFLRQDDFSAYMTEQAPEVAAATLDVRPFMGGELSLAFRQPVAVWQTPSSREYVDANGVVFSNNAAVEPTVVIKDESGLDVDGAAVTSGRFLNFIGQVIAGVDNGSIGKVESVSIPLGAIRYVELRLVGSSYPIKIQIDREPSSQVGDIVNMVKYLGAHGLTPSYVDVRVENKGYWK
ncbi:hypothetical protein FACS189431_5750 [Alphaproteobacteria bacterium]|nr:hypothetical protein FACS189431_5750 [Alphaproteobacteria bacterium]